jgi:hypothetical protein
MRKLLALALGAIMLTGGAWLAAVLQRPAPLPDELAIEEIATGAQAELAATYPEGASGLVRRDAHAKAHGCVKAIFKTDPELPQDLRVGTFASPGQARKALIRYSNGALHPGPDGQPDGRGMAIKLIDADPNKPGDARDRPPHDILMVNYPEFFISGIEDYRSFVRVHGLRGGEKDFKAYFQPGWNPFNWQLWGAKIAIANASRPIESPLRSDYFSMTPYGFGAGRIVKYAARPCAAPAIAPALPHDPDYLRTALVSELAGAPACFELLVQEQPKVVDLNDATQEWRTPLRRVGRIDIPAQSVDAPGRDAACENLSFNPVRAPAEHAPLGAINRIRAVVYTRIADYRMKRNNVIPTDPERAWDSF